MGCDIHAYLEIRRYPSGDSKRENGVWISADDWRVNHEYVLYHRDKKYIVENHIFEDRYYHMFAMLAGVRDAWGITPVCEPKGFPEDASPEVKEEKEYIGDDGHSHTWLTYGELSAYNWSELLHREEISKALDRMKAMLRPHFLPEYVIDENDVRVVFWFDN